MVLGEVVVKFGVSSFPEYDKLAFLGAILDPVKSYIGGFGAAFIDSIVGNISSGRLMVVAWLEDGGRMGPYGTECCKTLVRAFVAVISQSMEDRAVMATFVVNQERLS